MAARQTFDTDGLTAQAALVASGHAFSVCDARLPDLPLVWVNPAFERLTGYLLADVEGRNCRLLQGPDTERASTQRIRAALSAGRAVTETLLNYRADGSTWWNDVTITPVHSDTGELTHFVGVQSDVGDRVTAGRQRDEARTLARDAEARLYAGEHEVAIALQRSLLPALPRVDGLELAARYIPAMDSAEIGGDWYDVLPLPDGSTGLAVGDVMGHDIRAAAAMGQFRSVLRSYAWEGHGPAEVLERLNQLVCGLGMAQLATCVYARLEPARGDRPTTLRWSNAGHPPPMLLSPDGSARLLRTPPEPLLGLRVELPRTDHTVELEPGAVVVFYTDGLIERRDTTLDEGFEALLATLRGQQHLSAGQLCDRLIARFGRDSEDDIVLTVLHAYPEK